MGASTRPSQDPAVLCRNNSDVLQTSDGANHSHSMKDAFLGDIFNAVFKEHIAQLEMRIHQAIAYIVGPGQ